MCRLILGREISLFTYAVLSALLLLLYISLDLTKLKNISTIDKRDEILLDVTRQLYNSGNLQAPIFHKIERETRQISHSSQAPNIIHAYQDAYSIDKNGNYFPAKPLVYSIIMLPVYAIFGDFAASITPALIVWIITIIAALFYRQIYTNCSLAPLLFCLYFFSSLANHSFGLSYDALSPLFIVVGCCLLFKFPLSAGLVLSALTLVRPSLVLVPPFVLLSLLFRGCSLRSFLLPSLGFFIGTSAILLFYFNIFGDLFIFPQDRMPVYLDGEISGFARTGALSLEILTSEWSRKFFDYHAGLLNYDLILWIVPFALLIGRPKFWLVLTLIAFLVQALVIFSYFCWDCSNRGNRYLIGITILIAVHVTGLLLEYLNLRSGSLSSLPKKLS